MISKALVVGAYQRKAEEIADLGVDLTVLVPTAWKDRRGIQVAERLYVVGYDLRTIPICFNGHYHFHYYPTLRRELARIRPDIVHMDEEPYNLATWQGLRAAQVVDAHSLFFTWQNLYRQYPPPFRWIEQQNYRRAAVALAGNRDAASVLRLKGFPGTIVLIPQFGVDPSHFCPPDANEKETVADAHRALRIGYAGGLLPEKGIDDLLRACAVLKGEWRLRIVGEGSAKSALERLSITLGIASRVTIEKRRSTSDMPEFYRGQDVFVLPSRTQSNWKEQFGRVLVEAMACQIAVIGSSSGEIPNVIGNCGLLYQEGNWRQLAQCLQQIMDEPATRQQLARSGRDRVLSHYTMKQVAEATVEVYQQVLQSRKQ